MQHTSKWQLGFLNIGHFVDHLVILLFPAVAALILEREWEMPYSSLIALATPGLAAFGFASILAGWLGDRWNRQGMLLVFFSGIGVACIGAGLTNSPLQMAIAVFAIGFFASIYHPVGLAMLVEQKKRVGASLAINGVFGNIGVASSALLAGWLIQHSHWRMVFFAPGALCLSLGLGYGLMLMAVHKKKPALAPEPPAQNAQQNTNTTDSGLDKKLFLKSFAIALLVGACGATIFQSTTLSLPRLFSERLLADPSNSLSSLATSAGYWAFAVLVFAAFGQIVMGIWIDRGMLRKILILVVGLQAPLLFFLAQAQGIQVIILGAFAMFFIFGQVPLNDVLIARISHSSWRSRAYAVKYVVSFSVGSLAAPLIASMHAWRGFVALYVVLGIFAVLGLGAALSLPNSIALNPGTAAKQSS